MTEQQEFNKDYPITNLMNHKVGQAAKGMRIYFERVIRRADTWRTRRLKVAYWFRRVFR